MQEDEFLYGDDIVRCCKGEGLVKIGYIRVSRDKQTTALQEDALKKEPCERIFTEKLSGTRFDRPELLKLLEIARRGDVMVVWR